MELWIRTQDRESLEKVNNRLFVKEISKVGFTITNDLCIDDGFVNLGVYATKERALEVLDEIQKILKPKVIHKDIKLEQLRDYNHNTVIQPMINEIALQEFNTYVYEMPEDEV